MFLIAAISSFICIQLFSSVTSDTNQMDVRYTPTDSIPMSEMVLNKAMLDTNKNDEEAFGKDPKPTTFARSARRVLVQAGPFLRFGRSNLPMHRVSRAGSAQNGGTFLRFGRHTRKSAMNEFNRLNTDGFLRFG